MIRCMLLSLMVVVLLFVQTTTAQMGQIKKTDSAEWNRPVSPNQPVRPKDFKPFVFTPTEELRNKYSEQLMVKAAQEMARIEEVNKRAGNFKPTWESLDKHTVPEWYEDAKFGMFVDWGLYSVPAYSPSGYPDWYLWRMNTDTKAYHEKYWGDDFRADDFINLFTAKDFDAGYLAEVASKAGMRYVVPFLKHHDGFSLWNSSYTQRSSMFMGPKRDIAGEWKTALQKHNLKYGFYYSIDDWNYPVIGKDNQTYIRQWHATDGAMYKIEPYDKNKWDRMQISGKIPVRDFYNQYINPAAVEFIDKYDPDLIWADGDWIFDADDRNTRTLVAYYYNQAKGRKDVAINDAYGCTRLIPTLGQGPEHFPHGDFNRSEALYNAKSKIAYDRPWEECSGLSHSFGYHWKETDNDVRSAKELLTMLIDIVSGGGNLLLITNLTGSGKLDPLLAERLKLVGAWLEHNGESIYATRKWKHTREGNTRFTKSKDGKYVYAICLQWPGTQFLSKLVKPAKGATISMLGNDASLNWKWENNQLVVDVSKLAAKQKSKEAQNAWVFKIPVESAQ